MNYIIMSLLLLSSISLYGMQQIISKGLIPSTLIKSYDTFNKNIIQQPLFNRYQSNSVEKQIEEMRKNSCCFKWQDCQNCDQSPHYYSFKEPSKTLAVIAGAKGLGWLAAAGMYHPGFAALTLWNFIEAHCLLSNKRSNYLAVFNREGVIVQACVAMILMGSPFILVNPIGLDVYMSELAGLATLVSAGTNIKISMNLSGGFKGRKDNSKS